MLIIGVVVIISTIIGVVYYISSSKKSSENYTVISTSALKLAPIVPIVPISPIAPIAPISPIAHIAPIAPIAPIGPPIIKLSNPIEIVASSNEYYGPGNGEPWALFDDIIFQNNMWESKNDTYTNGITNKPDAKIVAKNGTLCNGEFVKAKFDKPYTLKKYEFYHRFDSVDLPVLPKKWYILGSNDGSNWNFIHTIEGFTTYQAQKPSTFEIINNTPYSNLL